MAEFKISPSRELWIRRRLIASLHQMPPVPGLPESAIDEGNAVLCEIAYSLHVAALKGNEIARVELPCLYPDLMVQMMIGVAAQMLKRARLASARGIDIKISSQSLEAWLGLREHE